MASPDRDEDRLADELAAYDEALRERRHAGDAPEAADLHDVLDRLERRYPRHSPAETREYQPGSETSDSGLAEAESRSPTGETEVKPQIGRFRVVRELGRGGFGVVFQAYDPKLQRHVALKVPRADSLSTDVMRKRFLHEAKAAAALDHPHVVPIYEVGEIGPLCYIALAYCEGQDLAKWLEQRDEPVPPRQAAAIIAALADGVQHGHERGILHRDLKPANIMLVPTSDDSVSGDDVLPFTPRVTDFGMAKLLDASLTETRSSIVMGTPLYMAPEQAEGRSNRVGPAVDVYALGAILYELLAGRAPFEADSLVAMLDRLRSCDTPDSPRNVRSSIPADLETICLKCLRREPSQRYESAAAFAADLRRFLRGEPIQARRLTWSERVRNWARRPRRILDAGIAMIVVNLALSAAMIAVSFGPVVDPGGAMAGMTVVELLRTQLPLALCGFSVAWLGFRIVKGDDWALWLGATAAAMQWLYCFAILFLGSPPFPMYQHNPTAKWLLHMLILLMFSVVLATCGPAIYARVKRP